MIYYNDSSQVRKCLNYQEFSTEYCDCVCVHKSIKSVREKYANKTGGHLKQKNRCFEENEMYISRYKMDFKTPFRVQVAQPSINHLNIERLCPIKQSPKIFYDDQKKSISFTSPKETNCSVSERRESSFKQPQPIKLKQKKKKNEIAKLNLKKSVISNQTIPVMKSYSNLKDHFPDDGKSIELASPDFNDENNQLSSKDNLTENKLMKPGSAFNEGKKQLTQQPNKYIFIKNKLIKAGSTFKPISSSTSVFSSDIELDGYLTRKKSATKRDFTLNNKNEDSNLKEINREESNQTKSIKYDDHLTRKKSATKRDFTLNNKNEDSNLKEINREESNQTKSIKYDDHLTRKKSAIKIDSTSKNKNENSNVKDINQGESNQTKNIESERYLNRKKSASKLDFTLRNKNEDLNLKGKKKGESNQKKFAYFVEYLHPKNETNEKESQITNQKNMCRHINLVCEICLNSFNFNKRKLYQFDLSNLNKDILVQKI
jgi:hypothetical protein